jgi:beta-glucosidase
VIFHLPADMLAYYDDKLDLVLESGKINIMIGSSSDDIRLRGSFEIVGAKKAQVKDRIFVCPAEVG